MRRGGSFETSMDTPAPKKRGRKPANGKTPLRSIRVADDEWAIWQAKAEEAGFVHRGKPDVSAWLRSLANRER